MVHQERTLLTPQQAADYLQVNKETILRYIRDGRLVASKLGRAYRIPRASIESLLWSTRTRDDIALRRYGPADVEAFLREDELDQEAEQVVARWIHPDRTPRT
jgi:excisionase family DNA binding protein